MVMVHGDDRGLVLPPRVASVQVIIVPVGITAKTTAETRAAIEKMVEGIASKLSGAGIRAKSDIRDNYTPGYKFNHWELRVSSDDIFQFSASLILNACSLLGM